jgi:hypothetical protein
MWRAALDAADYALTQCELRLDRIAGRATRLVAGRYAALVFIGAPIAWAFRSFHWDRFATLGLVGGVLLYAIVDLCKALASAASARYKR